MKTIPSIMKHITQTIGYIITNWLLILTLYSCNSNNTAKNNASCADSMANMTKMAATGAVAAINDSMNVNNNMNGANNVSSERNKMSKPKSPNNATEPEEPTGPGTLNVTSTAFTNNGVIPVKYTCDGQGATPPLNITNVPGGAKSLALIVHDYHASPKGGETFWIIWNLDIDGKIPENFSNNHESMNAAHQYGYTPICAKSGNHKYHFTVYALDCRLVLGKNTTKPVIENVMRSHVLAKGDLVGIYNKLIE